jgi:succinate dehydrogenase/fumarate reductase flavoprotein subunit
MLKGNIIETDVLIIGAGIAGIRAAVEAHDQGADVILTTKGVFGKDGGAVWMAGWGYQAALYPPDSLDQHIKDTIIGGKFLTNQELVCEFLKLAPKTVEELDRWGVRLGKKEGKFFQAALPGETYPRSLTHRRFGELLGGEYRKALPRQIKIREKIKVLEDMIVVDLIKIDGVVIGAVSLDIRRGELAVIKAKSTILATGGYMACFEFTSANPTLTGDGHGMAYRAGAKMMDMEFIQFFPTIAIWPANVYGDVFPYSFLAIMRGYFYNRLGERFMEKYYPVEKDFAPREAASRAIIKEVREGRGSPHGGAYLSIRHLPKNLIDNVLESLKDNPFFLGLKEAGFDIRDDAIEVAPGAHYVQGGCWINLKCETNLPGLYAIGEVGSGGKDGADRLAGNALTFCMVMGYVAGREAVNRAKNVTNIPEIDDVHIKGIFEQVLAPVNREEGVRPSEVKRRIKKLMSSYMVFARKEEELESCIGEIERIRGELIPKLYTKAKTKRFNLEWIDALETRNMLDVSEMAMRAALMRRESRGLHEREDYPDQDPDWLKHIMIENRNGEMVLETEPVAFPYLKPGDKKGG